jgi:hypothetical protein
MREDGRLTDYDAATGKYDVPAPERIHARLPACPGPGHVLGKRLICRRSPRSCAGRSPAGAAARGEDPIEQEGSPVQVPMTVELPAGRFTACVVRT